VLGLRPEHAGLAETGGWSLQVEVVETLGAERLVYCRMGKSLLTVRIDGTVQAPLPGQKLHIDVNAMRLHWFDAGTGQRV
jgi:sn-glycerol 3-phosphate transport system ATP-binding protein